MAQIHMQLPVDQHRTTFLSSFRRWVIYSGTKFNISTAVGMLVTVAAHLMKQKSVIIPEVFSTTTRFSHDRIFSDEHERSAIINHGILQIRYTNELDRLGNICTDHGVGSFLCNEPWASDGFDLNCIPAAIRCGELVDTD